MAELSIAEFEDLLATHGPELRGWPDGRRQQAEALLVGPEAAAARDALAAAEALDEALAGLAAEEAAMPLPDGLTARVLADAATVSADFAHRIEAAQRARPRRSWIGEFAEMFGGWRVATASVMVCAVVGLGVGFSTPDDAAIALGFEQGADEDLAVDLGWGLDDGFDNGSGGAG